MRNAAARAYAGRLPTEVAGFETHSGRICRTVFCFAQTRSPAIRY
jgi:hypothetical protein